MASGATLADAFRAIFGTTACAGQAVFLDAIPAAPPRLELDIMNPHVPDYYRDGGKTPPTDWQNPVPVYFLTVAPGTEFQFAVGWRGRLDATGRAHRERAKTWLIAALTELGAGAKTGAGYGYFLPVPTAPAPDAAALTGLSVDWPDVPAPGDDTAFVADSKLVAGDSVVLEEFSYRPDRSHAETIRSIGTWLADNALPETAEYTYWREALPRKLCILPENDFRDFVLHGTEVQTHVRLDPGTKTVATGALWTAESLPVDTLLYAPLLATPPRAKNGVHLDASTVIGRLAGLGLQRLQLGGDETTGQGIVALRFTRVHAFAHGGGNR